MQVDPTRLPSTPPVTAATPVREEPLPQWQVGQVLRATVVSASPTGQFTLAIEGQPGKFDVQGAVPLVAGQQIKLVVELVSGNLALRLLPERTAPDTLLSEAFRTVLPRETPLQPLFERLAQWVRDGRLPELPEPNRPGAPQPQSPATPANPGAPGGPAPQQRSAPALPLPLPAALGVPRELLSALRSLFQQMPTPQQLASPEGLKRALEQAGLFLEQKLAFGADGAQLTGDLKSALLKLVALLRQGAPGPLPEAAAGTPGRSQATPTPDGDERPPGQSLPLDPELQQLAREAEGALARVKLHQLQSMPTAERQEPAWVAEIPLRDGERNELLRLEIEREAARKGGGDEPVWSVRLAYTDPTHGPIAMVVSLTGQKVGTTFWAEQVRTAELFRDQLPLLEQRLRAAGFEVGALAARPGRPPSDRSWVEPLALLNVRA